MKYRIIHEPNSFEKARYQGGEYKVQKSLFGLIWTTPTIEVENNMKTAMDWLHITIDKTFNTVEEAEQYIVKKKGKKIIKEY